jgi:hypothetical protein
MAINYKTCADVVVPQHVCDDCAILEQGGIRSIALVKDTFSFTDITDKDEWIAGIEDGDIIVIPKTIGTFDGGSPIMIAGFGDDAEAVSGFNFTLAARDPAYKQNGVFWNAIRKHKDMLVAWRTATQIHISGAAVTISPLAPVEEGTDSVVTWQVTFTWKGEDLPEPNDGTALKDEIFTCFEVS